MARVFLTCLLLLAFTNLDAQISQLDQIPAIPAIDTSAMHWFEPVESNSYDSIRSDTSITLRKVFFVDKLEHIEIMTNFYRQGLWQRREIFTEGELIARLETNIDTMISNKYRPYFVLSYFQDKTMQNLYFYNSKPQYHIEYLEDGWLMLVTYYGSGEFKSVVAENLETAETLKERRCENGQVIYSYWSIGKGEVVYNHYNCEGELESEGIRKEGHNVGHWKFYKKGSLYQEGSFNSYCGLHCGIWKYYGEDGSLTGTKVYPPCDCK